MLETVFFYLMAGGILASAWYVVTARNLFRSAMGLIAVLTGIAGLYLLLNAQLLAAVQVAVYIGGIVVLIVFVILLVSDVTQAAFQPSSGRLCGWAGLTTLMLLGFMMFAIGDAHLASSTLDSGRSATIAEIGRALLLPAKGGFVLPFEVVSVLLLAAMIGALTVARPEAQNGSTETASPAPSPGISNASSERARELGK